MSELTRIQSRFAEALLKGGDETPNLFCAGPQAPTQRFNLSAEKPGSKWGSGSNSQRLTRRFNLYRGNLTANWENSLKMAYPVLQQLVGDDFFRAMAKVFGRSKSNTQGDLNTFGERFADFILDFVPLQAYPYIADVVRLEWQLHRAYYAEDSDVLDITTFINMVPDLVESLQLELTSGSFLFHSSWDAVGIWQAHQPGATKQPGKIYQASRCLVYRPYWRPTLLPISQAEFVALHQINLGVRLGEALETAADIDPDFAPDTVFPRWLQAGIFAPLKNNEITGDLSQ